MRLHHSALLVTLLVGATGCPDDPAPAPPAPKGSAAPAASGTAASTAGAQASPTSSAATQPASEAGEATCESMNQEMWVDNANPRTGITVNRTAEGELLVGVAVGNRPYKLSFNEKGRGSLKRLNVDEKLPFGKPPKKGEGVRHLQRVTPTSAMYFVDYRDKFEDGHRRISCGPLNKEPYVVFDGMPLLHTDDSGRKKVPTPGEVDGGGGAKAEGAGGAAGEAPKRDVVAPKKRREVELRDCRTFADVEAKDVWSVGSELVGEEHDGKKLWFMDFFVLTNAGKGPRVLLQRNALGEEPKKLHTLEAPVAHKLADGNFVLAGRYKGRMLAWLLNEQKKKQTVLHRYGGGYPSLPRIVPDGSDHILLTSQKVDAERWALKTLPLPNPSKLVDQLTALSQGDEDSRAEPTIAQIDGQRWLQFHQGDRRKGQVTVVAVNDKLEPMGKPYKVTKDEVAAYESHVFPIDSRKWLLSVYISRPEPGHPAELRSEMLKCNAP